MIRAWLWPLACGLGLLASAVPAVAGTSKLPVGAVLMESESQPRSAAKAATLSMQALRALANGDAEAALQALRAESDPIARESAAVRVIEAIQARGPSEDSDQVLAALEQEPVLVFSRHEETAADWFLPVFNVPAQAASTRELFAAQQRRDALKLALERDPQVANASADAATLAGAIMALSPEAIRGLRTAALRTDLTLPSPAWTALARRSPDSELLEAVLRQAEPLDVLPLMQELSATLAPKDALVWLEKSTRDPELASASVMAIGSLVPRLPQAETVLAKHLGSPITGASAAAALAQLPAPERLKRIEAWIDRSDEPLALQHLALALRLEGSPAAQKRLQQLANDERLGESLRRELQR